MRANLKAYIKANNINISGLAREIGVPDTALHNIFTGRAPMGFRVSDYLLKRFADAPIEVRMECQPGGLQCEPIRNQKYLKRGGLIDHWHTREGKTELAWGSKARCTIGD